jgi:hypothetical protein
MRTPKIVVVWFVAQLAWLVLLGLLLFVPACHEDVSLDSNDGGVGGADAHDQGLLVTPDPAALDVDQGGPAAMQSFTAIAHLPGGDQDVSDVATWTLADPNVGTLFGKLFMSRTDHGGTTTVQASYTTGGHTYTGTATLHVKLHARPVVDCPGCPAFPPDNAPTCTTPGATPTLVYPPDGVLLPPNMNVIDVQFLPGAGQSVFEIDFENAATDVRVETACAPVDDVRGNPTGGCAFTLDPMVWSTIADSNRGGDPVRIMVRAAPADVSCVAASAERSVSFATEDLHGGIYYWQSVTQGGIAGKTGGIFRKDFGDPATPAEAFLTPGQTNRCIGCHFLSRDGQRITYGNDDADSDDEYGDLSARLLDVSSKTAIGGALPPGFQAFSPDHTRLLAGDGKGVNNPPIFTLYDGDAGTSLGSVAFPAFMGKRVTQPDWSKDGLSVYFTVPGKILTNIGMYKAKDDLHFSGGSLYVMSYDPASGMFGAPLPLVQSAGPDENDYYPAISPDGAFLVFDRAVGTTLETHDSYNNPAARLHALALAGGAPVDMQRANAGDGLTNSWPRWSPFVQQYKGKRLLWITFSSTRDYGLKVRNQNVAPPLGPLVNCYPPESPENPDGAHSQPFPPNCTQPQIWMAAVSLDDLLAGHDPSFAAFWLPFQDVTAHNHIAQWTEAIVGPPPGTCGVQGDVCQADPDCCVGYVCDPMASQCQFVIP